MMKRIAMDAITRMTAATPLVMCVTNRVMPQRVADIVLAAGASPAMIDNPAEVPAFAAISSVVYVNAGLHASQCGALAALGAMAPPPLIVLDPVGYGASEYRNNEIMDFITRANPAAIRANANEICGLAGVEAKGQGVDSEAATEAAIEPALVLARRFSCVVTISGDSDIVVDAAGRAAKVVGDVPMMASFTGAGCALGALVAACVSTSADDRFAGALGAHALYTAAAVRASARPEVRGPGSLAVALPDELYTLTRGGEVKLEEALGSSVVEL